MLSYSCLSFFFSEKKLVNSVRLDKKKENEKNDPCILALHYIHAAYIQSTIVFDLQAEGKKRMKAIGRVDVPQEAFMAVLKLEKEVL